MTFGAYPQQHKMSVSLQTPFLDAAGEPSEALTDLEWEPGSSSRLRYIKKARSWTCLFFLALLAFVTGMLIIIIRFALLRKLWGDAPDHLEVLGELNGLVPSFGTAPKLFAPYASFDPLNISDPIWEEAMPTGGGFVHIQDWQNQDLPEPIQTHGKTLYNVAVFHQLHCLHILAEEFGNLLAARNKDHKSSMPMGDSGIEHDHEKSEDEDMMMIHVRHCFEYIKTSLMCCADTALEGQKNDINQPAADGFGSQHVCRNFDAVFDWAKTHRGTDQTGYPH